MNKTNIHNTASQVGQRIKKARLALGLSQQEVGDKLFKTGAAIGYIERGKRGVSVEDLALFAEVLNVPITYFFDTEISQEQQLQDTLRNLQKHIAKLNQTISKQALTIDDLIDKLPRTEELRLISDASIDPIVVINTKGNVIFATSSIFNITGFTNTQMIGRHVDDFAYPGQIKTSKEILSQILKTKKLINAEIAISHASGRQVDIEINARTIELDGKTVIHGVLRDISQRKKMARELQENKEKYQQFLDQSTDGIFVAQQDYTVVEWNPALEKITGISRAEAIGQKSWRLFARQSRLLNITQAKKFGSLLKAEIMSKRKIDKQIIRKVEVSDAKGKQVTLEANFFPIHMGEKTYIGGVIRLVT